MCRSLLPVSVGAISAPGDTANARYQRRQEPSADAGTASARPAPRHHQSRVLHIKYHRGRDIAFRRVFRHLSVRRQRALISIPVALTERCAAVQRDMPGALLQS